MDDHVKMLLMEHLFKMEMLHPPPDTSNWFIIPCREFISEPERGFLNHMFKKCSDPVRAKNKMFQFQCATKEFMQENKVVMTKHRDKVNMHELVQHFLPKWKNETLWLQRIAKSKFDQNDAFDQIVHSEQYQDHPIVRLCRLFFCKSFHHYQVMIGMFVTAEIADKYKDFQPSSQSSQRVAESKRKRMKTETSATTDSIFSTTNAANTTNASPYHTSSCAATTSFDAMTSTTSQSDSTRTKSTPPCSSALASVASSSSRLSSPSNSLKNCLIYILIDPFAAADIIRPHVSVIFQLSKWVTFMDSYFLWFFKWPFFVFGDEVKVKQEALDTCDLPELPSVDTYNESPIPSSDVESIIPMDAGEWFLLFRKPVDFLASSVSLFDLIPERMVCFNVSDKSANTDSVADSEGCGQRESTQMFEHSPLPRELMLDDEIDIFCNPMSEFCERMHRHYSLTTLLFVPPKLMNLFQINSVVHFVPSMTIMDYRTFFSLVDVWKFSVKTLYNHGWKMNKFCGYHENDNLYGNSEQILITKQSISQFKEDTNNGKDNASKYYNRVTSMFERLNRLCVAQSKSINSASKRISSSGSSHAESICDSLSSTESDKSRRDQYNQNILEGVAMRIETWVPRVDLKHLPEFESCLNLFYDHYTGTLSDCIFSASHEIQCSSLSSCMHVSDLRHSPELFRFVNISL